MVYRSLAILIFLSGVAGGCARMADDYVVAAGHPADPAARPGTSLAGSGALDPELRTVTPQVSTAPQTPPSSGGHQHN